MNTALYRRNFAEIDWSVPLPDPPPRKPDPDLRSPLACPMIVNDQLDRPLQSMADGSWHTTKSGLRATYKPSGNPEGIRFVETGGERQKRERQKWAKREDIKAAVEKAASQHKLGRRVNMHKIATE